MSFDNCGIADISVSQSEFDCMDLGINIITLTVTDFSGNIDSCTSTVTVVDNIKPVAPAAPIDGTVQCADDVPVPVELTATDNCGDITVSPMEVLTPGACANDFSIVRTWTFIDNSGNQSSISQTITVKDDT